MRVYKFRVNDDTKYFLEGMVEIESLGKLILAQAPLTLKTKQGEAVRSYPVYIVYNDNLLSA